VGFARLQHREDEIRQAVQTRIHWKAVREEAGVREEEDEEMETKEGGDKDGMEKGSAVTTTR